MVGFVKKGKVGDVTDFNMIDNMDNIDKLIFHYRLITPSSLLSFLSLLYPGENWSSSQLYNNGYSFPCSIWFHTPSDDNNHNHMNDRQVGHGIENGEKALGNEDTHSCKPIQEMIGRGDGVH